MASAGMALAMGLGAAGSLGAGALGANAAQNAASTEAQTAEQAANLQAQLGQENLGYENYTYQQGLANEEPWLQSGANSLASLNYLMGVGSPSAGTSASPVMPTSGTVNARVNPGTGLTGISSPINASGAFQATPQAVGARTSPTAGAGQITSPLSGAGTGRVGSLPSAGLNQGSGVVEPASTLSIPGVQGSVNLPAVKALTGTPDTSLGSFGSLAQAQYPGGNFQAPTAAQAAAEPGYQFALSQGEKAMQASAAANGSLLTGGTMNALDSYAQGLADTNYNTVYNQALQGYQTNYNTWANQQANQYNRLASMSGMGQVTAQQLGSLGANSAGQVGNTLSNTASQIGQQLNNIGSAIGSGYAGSANALGGGISGVANSLSNAAMLGQLMNNGGSLNSLGSATSQLSALQSLGL